MKKLIILTCLTYGLITEPAAVKKTSEVSSEQQNESLDIAKNLINWIHQNIPDHYQNAFQNWLAKRANIITDIAVSNAGNYQSPIMGAAYDADTTGMWGNTDLYVDEINQFEKYQQVQEDSDLNIEVRLSAKDIGLHDEKQYQEFMEIALTFIPKFLQKTYSINKNIIAHVLQLIISSI